MSSSYFSASLDDFSTSFSNMNQIPGSNCLYNYNQMGQIPTPNSHFMQSGSIDMGYSHPDQGAAQRRCKMEQFPNHSMVSDDTGLSTDRNTEISSVVSSYDGLDVPATGAALYLDNMWKCWLIGWLVDCRIQFASVWLVACNIVLFLFSLFILQNF